MRFCFYPNHEYSCPQVSHCPHLGGASVGTLVLAAGEVLITPGPEYHVKVIRN